MKSRDFCYWLQGWFELNKTIDHRGGTTPETMKVIENHLAMVFKHEIDPSHGDAEHQKDLSKAHQGGTGVQTALVGVGGMGTLPSGLAFNC